MEKNGMKREGLLRGGYKRKDGTFGTMVLWGNHSGGSGEGVILMSLIVTIHVEEGIVMAGDSRLTSSLTRKEGEKVIHDIGAHTSESANKVFFGSKPCGDLRMQRSEC